MKKTYYLFIFAFMIMGCKKTDNQSVQKVDESSVVMDSIALWDTFRHQIATNDSDFDMLKHYDPNVVSSDVANQLLEDDYTKNVLSETPFDQLEDEILDDKNAKALYVLMASQDITIGTIYYFQFTSYGIQLIGTMPY